MYTRYKQSIDYFNDLPNNLVGIKDIAYGICTSKYQKGVSCKTLEEALNRPTRYFFYFVTKNKALNDYVKNCCYFDDKKQAQKAFEQIQDIYFSEMNLKLNPVAPPVKA